MDFERQRYMAHPSAEAVWAERERVCAALVAYRQSLDSRERLAYKRAHDTAEEMYYRTRRGEVELPLFDRCSLFYFEIVLAHVTGQPVRL